MLGHNFYHGIIRKTTALVGTLFNDLYIVREAADGTEEQRVRIPLYYGPREKYLARNETDPNLDQKVALQLPAISFELTGIRYDASRKLSTTGTIRMGATAPSGKAYATRAYNPVPYDLSYVVTIYSNNEEDGMKIVEQILPYFTPTWNVTVKMIEEAPDLKTDVYVELNSVPFEDLYEENFSRRRVVTWRLELTVKTYFYGPVAEAKVIKIAFTNYYVDLASQSPAVVTTIRPGLTANGEPTTSMLDTVPVSEIEEYDPWDYIVVTEEHL